ACVAMSDLATPPDDIIHALRLRLDDDDPEVRAVAAMALARLKTAHADAFVRLDRMATTDPDVTVRGSAERVLLAVRGAPPPRVARSEELVTSRRASDPRAREAAIDTIATIGVEQLDAARQHAVLEALTDRLSNDPYFQSRMSAALAFWKIKQAPAFVID